MTGATILVADDNEQLRVITARILRAAGYAVIEASDGSASETVDSNFFGPM